MNVLELVFIAMAAYTEIIYSNTCIYVCTRYYNYITTGSKCSNMGYHIRGIPYDLCRYKTLSKE